MFKVRPVRMADVDALVKLTRQAGLGMTTLPKSRDEMVARVNKSLRAFANQPDQEQTFQLVLEEHDQTISGLTAIYTNLGAIKPFYSYRLSRLVAQSPEIDIVSDVQILNLVNDYHGYCEIGSLFLAPEYRKQGRGRLLSYARFLLLAALPEVFGDKIMAEMRGVSDAAGISPFWEAVGRKFFQLDFSQADALSSGDNRFIAELMPKYPIYVELLPEAARQVIAKTHHATIPARRLLEKQGFRFNNLIDIFDGGPSLEANVKYIPTIATANLHRLNTIRSASGSDLVANPQRDQFAVCYYQPRQYSAMAQLLGCQNDSQVLLAHPGGSN